MKTIDQASFFSILNSQLEKEGRTLQPTEYVVSDEKQVVYLVNSKVACSSIKATFFRQDIPDDHTIHIAAKQHGLLYTDLSDAQKKYYTFTFVRNPFARLVSCYESKYHVDPVRYRHVDDFSDYLFGYIASDEGFDVFIRKICALPPRLMDRHFRSQYDLIYDDQGNCRCDFVGHFEHLEAEFKPIQNRFGLQPLPHMNRSKPVDWRTYYTDETRELVRKTFQRDFEVFGYDSRV